MTITRRRLLGTCLAPALAGGSLAQALPTTALTDVLERPAVAVNPASKPVMLRIVRAADRFVAVGERGLILFSDDDGRSWQQAGVPVSVTLTGVRFIDARRGWAVGHAGVILHTEDGGKRWARQFDGRSLADGPANPLFDLCFVDEHHGWAVGAYGLVLRTDDGGRRWQPAGAALPNPKGLHCYALARQAERLFIAGEQGLFLSMTSTGDDAQAMPTPYRGSFFTLTALPEGRLLLGGLRGTVLLREPGGDFGTVESGTQQAIVSAALLASGRLALVDQSGRVLVGAPPVAAGAGGLRMRPAEAERRWVSVAEARDGALVGACTIGVGRLADARTPAT